MIIAGYYDESMERPAFAVAGYLAQYQTWLDLDWAWQGLLKAWNIKYFKASECENLLGEFAQYRKNPEDLKSQLEPHEWQTVKRAKTQFIGEIAKHADGLNGVGAGIVLPDFERLVSENHKALRYLTDNPYYIGLQLSLIAGTVAAANHNDETKNNEDHIRIKPIFDSHKDYSALAKAVFDKFITKNPRSASVLLPLDYEDDIEVPALQIADTLAYEVRKYLSDKLVNPQKEPRTAFRRLLPTIHKLYRIDYAQLSRIVEKQNPSDSIPIEPIIDRTGPAKY